MNKRQTFPSGLWPPRGPFMRLRVANLSAAPRKEATIMVRKFAASPAIAREAATALKLGDASTMKFATRVRPAPPNAPVIGDQWEWRAKLPDGDVCIGVMVIDTQ